MEPETQYGTVEDLPGFTQISGLIETLTLNGPDDVLCYFTAIIDPINKGPLYTFVEFVIVCVLRHISTITAMVPIGPRQAMG